MTSNLVLLGKLGQMGDRGAESLLARLRQARALETDPATFDERVRWPAIQQFVAAHGPIQMSLSDGTLFEVHGDNPIERALLLSPEPCPDHVWEPQTTRLLHALVEDGPAIVGGAFVGDQAIPIARTLHARPGDGAVYAFEPMATAFKRLARNIDLNQPLRMRPERLALWDNGHRRLRLTGELALASSANDALEAPAGELVEATSVDAYTAGQGLDRVRLIALDMEGGELHALRGAETLLAQPSPDAPHIVFEIHRAHVDWSHGLAATEPVRLLRSFGYDVVAIRDYQGNVAMGDLPIELVPLDDAHLEGPPHGFNLLASKEMDAIVARHRLELVPGVSPKLLRHADPRLHAPRA